MFYLFDFLSDTFVGLVTGAVVFLSIYGFISLYTNLIGG